MGIPIRFIQDLSICFPIKIQTRNFMNGPVPTFDQPLTPALFQIASRVDELESALVFKGTLAIAQIPLGEMMLDAKKFEVILKAVGRKKKSGQRASISFEGRQ